MQFHRLLLHADTAPTITLSQIVQFVQGLCEKLVVTPLGLEPRTCGLKVRCSAN